MRLRAKIILSTVIPLAILIALVIRWNLEETREEITNRVQRMSMARARVSGLLMDGELRRAAQIADTAALAVADSIEWTTDELQLFAHSIVSHDPVISGFSFAWAKGKGPSGKELQSESARRKNGGVEEYDLQKIVDYANDPRFKKLKQTRQAFWSDSIHEDPTKNSNIVFYISPILRDNVFLGATVVDVQIDRLSELTRRIGLGKGTWFLLDNTGALVGVGQSEDFSTVEDPSPAMRSTIEMVTKKADGTSLFSRVSGAEADVEIRNFSWEGDQPFIIAAAPVPLNDWVIFTTKALSVEIESAQWEVVEQAIIAVVIGLTLIVIVVLGIWRVVLRPVRRLESVVQDVAEGNFDVRADLPGKDELARLGNELDEMIPRFEELLNTRATLEVARKVQMALVPQKVLATSDIAIAGRTRSSEQTGGDFFGFIDPHDYPNLKGWGERSIGMYLGDVSGHGIPAALLATTARAYVRGTLLVGTPPEEAVAEANIRLVEDTGYDRFVVFLLASHNAETQELSTVAAGHPYFLLRAGSDTFEEFKARSIPLGIDSEATFPAVTSTDVGPDSILLIASDGAWESRNSANEEFGFDRLFELVIANRDREPEAIIERFFEVIDEWNGEENLEDDCTIVIAKIRDPES